MEFSWVWLLAALFVILVVVILVRTRAAVQTRPPVEPAKLVEVDAEAAAGRLAALLRVQTISGGMNPEEVEITAANHAAFAALQDQLASFYPHVFASLEIELFNTSALLLTWPGTNPELEPVLFAAHQDVVPADPGTLDKWEHAPFAGDVADGYVWGRGALDMKNQLAGLLEAVELLLTRGHTPERTIYLAFGHDEEVGGHFGASAIAAALKERGVHLAAVLDEGGVVANGMVPGVDVPVAMIGVGEKGYLTLELSCEGAAGHSSTPPETTTIGILARAIARLEAHQMAPRPAAVAPMFLGLGEAAPYKYRLFFSNLWLFGGLVSSILQGRPQTNAQVRTTTAVTLIAGGLKDNILPPIARAGVNFRLLPGDTLENVLVHARDTINDERVKLRVPPGAGWEASPVSSTGTPAFARLYRAIHQVFGDVAVTPYLMLGASDARHYTPMCSNVFRFSPVALDEQEINRIHGLNERISVSGLGQMVQFFCQMISEWGDGGW